MPRRYARAQSHGTSGTSSRSRRTFKCSGITGEWAQCDTSVGYEGDFCSWHRNQSRWLNQAALRIPMDDFKAHATGGRCCGLIKGDFRLCDNRIGRSVVFGFCYLHGDQAFPWRSIPSDLDSNTAVLHPDESESHRRLMEILLDFARWKREWQNPMGTSGRCRSTPQSAGSSNRSYSQRNFSGTGASEHAPSEDVLSDEQLRRRFYEEFERERAERERKEWEEAERERREQQKKEEKARHDRERAQREDQQGQLVKYRHGSVATRAANTGGFSESFRFPSTNSFGGLYQDHLHHEKLKTEKEKTAREEEEAARKRRGQKEKDEQAQRDREAKQREQMRQGSQANDTEFGGDFNFNFSYTRERVPRWSPGDALREYQKKAEAYDKIKKFDNKKQASFALIPWPVLAHPSVLRPSIVTWLAVEEFFNSIRSSHEKRGLLIDAQRRFHENRVISRGVLSPKSIPDDAERNSVEKCMGLVSQAVNSLVTQASA